MTQEQLRIAYEMSKAARNKAAAAANGGIHISANNSYLSDENLDPSSSPANNSARSGSPRLTSNHLQQWERHTSGTTSPMGGTGATSRPIYTISSELPHQQMQAMDDMNRSDASSSSFNLSTDAEDSEYEQLKRRGRYPIIGGPSTLDTSAIETATSYTTDEDRKIFPNLPTDDEMTQATEPSFTQPPSLLMPLHTPDDEPGRIQILPTSRETADDLRAWTLAPPRSAPIHHQGPPTIKSSVARDQHFFPASNTTNNNNNVNSGNTKSMGSTNLNGPATTTSSIHLSMMQTAHPAANNHHQPKPTPTAVINNSNMTSRNTPTNAGPRNFTSPKSQASSNTDFSTKEFGKDFADGFGDFGADFNFADFSSFPASDGIWKGEEKKMQPWEDLNEPKEFEQKNPTPSSNFGGQLQNPQQQQPQHQRSHSHPWTTPSSVFDSSAAMTVNTNSKMPTSLSPQSPGEFDDPFDIAVKGLTNGFSSDQVTSGIQTQDKSLSELLEAAKQKRRPRNRASSSSVNSAPAITAAYLRQHHNLGRYSTGSYTNNDRVNTTGEGTSVSDIIESLEATHIMKRGNNVYSHRSVGETGAVATARAAKERLREKRRREREMQGIRNNRSTEISDSDESDHEASESWLFDEVTGALGPRGIAADLESLSGRSNRSKNSHGNKSHKSSRRKSSRKSSSRRRTDQSVDSHGSRTSRNSRYSHRSTKSFLSQMSEQSRSVANDLLRLEMQLAMVGSQDKRDDVVTRPASSGASLGGTSRGTTRSSSRKAPSTSTNSSRGIHPSPIADVSAAIRRTKITVVAPPGKLGIILANKADSKGTVVSGVRTSSVLVDRISPGDRIVAIDGEDVSRMTVSEITTIMSRKAEYERHLTVLTIPKQGNSSSNTPAEGVRSPTSMSSNEFETSFSNYRR
jgi:hypothetical protein